MQNRNPSGNKTFPASLIIVWALLAPTPTVAGTLSPELSAQIAALGPAAEIPVIITFTEKVDIAAFRSLDRKIRRQEIVGAMKGKAVTQRKEVSRFLSDRGRRATDLWIINALAARLAVDVIDAVSRFPGVESVRRDVTLQAPSPVVGAAAQPEWNIARVRAPELWALGFTGAGVTVATLDTGVDIFHPDLQARWRGGANSWFNPYAVDCMPCLSYDRNVCPARIACGSCDLSGSDPCDLDGHGTQTMGIIIGGAAGGTAIGVAPGSRWLAAKIFADPVGASPPEALASVIHQAFQWVLDPDGDAATDDAPDVVNNSWGLSVGNACLAEFEPDIAALKASGIAVVFAAGNEGPAPASSESPANYAESFSVGAVDDADAVVFSSSRGPSACTGSMFPRVAAPGANIRTSDLTFGGVIPDAYGTVSGTSFAAPHVAGAMALLLSTFPNTPTADLERAVTLSAVDLGAAGPDNDYGSGLVDVAAAYQRLLRRTRIGVFGKGPWYLDADGNGVWNGESIDIKHTAFGFSTGIPVTGDWDGDGKTEIGVFSKGTWYLDADGNGVWGGESVDIKYAAFGFSTDIPVTGDWDGNGKTEIGVFSNGVWYLDADANGVWNGESIDIRHAAFGFSTDIPVTGDWNGDGKTEIGVFSKGAWYLDADGNGVWSGESVDIKYAAFGFSTDIPVTGDWNGDGKTEIGVFKNGAWYLDADGNGAWNGEPIDIKYGAFGFSKDIPVSWKW